MSVTSAPAAGSTRLRALDALRGIAAFSVVLFHLRAQGRSSAWLDHLPAPVRWPFFHGNIGVQIFFVLSGFVIAHSMDGHVVDARFIRRFALRRSLRLDPVYWGCLAFILLPGIAAHVVGVRSGPLSDVVTLRELLANLFYLPAITNTRFIHDGAWTLCLEVQFYLLYAVVRSLTRRLGPRHHDAATLAVLAALCLLADVLPANRPYRGSILHVLVLFLPGIAAARLFAARTTPARATHQQRYLLVAIAACLWPLGVGIADGSGAVASGLTGLLLLGLILGNQLHRPFGRVLQYLGSRSYSIYLFHMVALIGPAGWVVRKLDNGSVVGQLAAAVAMLTAELLLAEIAYRVLERTSVRFAKRISHTGPLFRSRRTATAAVASP